MARSRKACNKQSFVFFGLFLFVSRELISDQYGSSDALKTYIQLGVSLPFLATSGSSTTTRTSNDNKADRYAVVHYVDNDVDNGDGFVWGVYSVHEQMRKFGMLDGSQNHKYGNISHVLVVPNTMSAQREELLQTIVGSNGQVLAVDPNSIRKRVNTGVWAQVFSKFEAFNLTDYDKVIVLDLDILIRTNIAHWFDYPAPAATAAGTTIEWNSGAMVISPNAHTYELILEYITKSFIFKSSTNESHRVDTWNSDYHDQGMLSSFFTSNVTNDTMFTMPYGSAVLSSALQRENSLKYFARHRNHMIETVHFTVYKPYRGSTNDFDVCKVLCEWERSVVGAADLPNMPPLNVNPTKNCPNACNITNL